MPINHPIDVCRMQPRNVRDQEATVRLITVSACITTALVLPGCGMARPSLAAAYTGVSASVGGPTASLSSSAFIMAMGTQLQLAPAEV